MGRAKGLTTTSYVMLGHFALRDWAPYDLAREMRRNICYFFPRAESQVYAEPPRLESLGLLESRKEANGRRERTVYRITPEGRDALAAWLGEPVSKGPQLEFEAIARVLFGPFGGHDDLRQAVASVQQDGRAMADTAARIGGEYAAGRAPFQKYVQHRALLHDFLTHFALLMESWGARSLERIAAWEQEDEAEREAAALASIAAVTAQIP